MNGLSAAGVGTFIDVGWIASASSRCEGVGFIAVAMEVVNSGFLSLADSRGCFSRVVTEGSGDAAPSGSDH